MSADTDNPPLPPRMVVHREATAARVTFPRRQVDGIAVRELYEFAAALTDEPTPRLIVDLTDVVLVNSGAMGMLVNIHKKLMGHGGRLHVYAPAAQVMQSFEVMQLHRLLKLYDDLTAARQF